MTTTNLRRAKREPHIVGTGPNAIVVSLPDVYGTIGDVVGVKKLTGDPPEGASGGEVKDILRNGQAIKVTVAYKVGGKRKEAEILCEIGKIKTAMPSLPSKTFNGGDIIKAYFKRKRRLS